MSQHAEQLATLAHQQNTHKVYDHAGQLFLTFLHHYNLALFTLVAANLVDFAALLSISGFAPSTITTYISGVRHNLRRLSLLDFTNNRLLSMVLKGANRSDGRADVRLPILFDLLKDMCRALQFTTLSLYDYCMYKALLALGFFGLFRPGELMLSQHAILIENVFLLPNAVRVVLLTSKSSRKFPQPVDVPIQESCCPKAMLWQFLQIRPPSRGQLYIHQDGSPVTYNNLVQIFKGLCAFLNLPPGQFTPHSLHIGGTTHLFSLGKSKIFIQSFGRWSSDCYTKYIRQ